MRFTVIARSGFIFDILGQQAFSRKEMLLVLSFVSIYFQQDFQGQNLDLNLIVS